MNGSSSYKEEMALCVEKDVKVEDKKETPKTIDMDLRDMFPPMNTMEEAEAEIMRLRKRLMKVTGKYMNKTKDCMDAQKALRHLKRDFMEQTDVYKGMIKAHRSVMQRLKEQRKNTKDYKDLEDANERIRQLEEALEEQRNEAVGLMNEQRDYLRYLEGRLRNFITEMKEVGRKLDISDFNTANYKQAIEELRELLETERSQLKKSEKEVAELKEQLAVSSEEKYKLEIEQLHKKLEKQQKEMDAMKKQLEEKEKSDDVEEDVTQESEDSEDGQEWSDCGDDLRDMEYLNLE